MRLESSRFACLNVCQQTLVPLLDETKIEYKIQEFYFEFSAHIGAHTETI